MAIERFKTTTRQKVKPATHHKKSMNSDQTTTQSKFVAVFMVLICGVLQALFSESCGCFQVSYSYWPVTTRRHPFSGAYFNMFSVSMVLSD
jgi:hypothetical protein